MLRPEPETPLEQAAPVSAWQFLTRHWAGRLLIGLALLGGLIWVVGYFTNLVVYLVVGLLLAYLLRPVVDRVQQLGLGRVPAILLTMLLLAGLISLAFTSLVPFLARQLAELSRLISLESLQGAVAQFERWLMRFFPIQPGTLMDTLQQGFETLIRERQLASTIGSMLDLFANLFYAVLVIPFVTFFCAQGRYPAAALAASPGAQSLLRADAGCTGQAGGERGPLFSGVAAAELSVATLASVLLAVVGLRFAVAVGLFTGIANTIPYFGPLMGFLAGTLVGIAQTGDFSMVPEVLIAMGLTQIADNVLFQPLIFSRAARAHPLVILFAVLVGAQLAGIVGMLLAIPILTIVRVAAEQVRWGVRNYRILNASVDEQASSGRIGSCAGAGRRDRAGAEPVAFAPPASRCGPAAHAVGRGRTAPGRCVPGAAGLSVDTTQAIVVLRRAPELLRRWQMRWGRPELVRRLEDLPWLPVYRWVVYRPSEELNGQRWQVVLAGDGTIWGFRGPETPGEDPAARAAVGIAAEAFDPLASWGKLSGAPDSSETPERPGPAAAVALAPLSPAAYDRFGAVAAAGFGWTAGDQQPAAGGGALSWPVPHGRLGDGAGGSGRQRAVARAGSDVGDAAFAGALAARRRTAAAGRARIHSARSAGSAVRAPFCRAGHLVADRVSAAVASSDARHPGAAAGRRAGWAGLCRGDAGGALPGMLQVPDVWLRLLILLMSTLVVGVFGAASVFLLAGTSDALARDRWPEKLAVLTLLRNGQVRNVVVGASLLRGLALGGLLLGMTVG
ncbi:AI-2E family transporter, partial [Rhodothermus marinus]|uniref:AI-2E family transporter n=1 Tax=Rhodothermus marinus TaxID=29549 RepID=UPI001FB348EA